MTMVSILLDSVAETVAATDTVAKQRTKGFKEK
jgi:hypothetical protein